MRIALGAPSRNVIAATVGHHVPPAAIGIALGAGISIAGLAMLSTDDASMVRELALAAAMSPRWWIALTGLLLVTTLLSATVPVLGALRLSPADVLRREQVSGRTTHPSVALCTQQVAHDRISPCNTVASVV